MAPKYLDTTAFKNRVMNTIITAGAVISSFALIIIALRDFPDNMGFSFYIQCAAVAGMWILTGMRHRLSLSFKNFFTIGTILAIFLNALLNMGFYASAKAYIILAPVLISFIVPYRKALLLLIVFAGIYLVFAFLYTRGYLTHQHTSPQYIVKVSAWLTDCIILFLCAFCLLYVGNSYNREIRQNLSTIQQKNQDLEVADKKYHEVYDAANDAIFIQDAQSGQLLDVNQSAVRIFGYRNKEELLSKTIQDISVSDKGFDEAEILKKIKSAREQSRLSFEWLSIKKDGTPFWIEVSLRHTEILGEEKILATIRDIDEKKQKEAELERHKSQLENLVKEKTNDLQSVNRQLQKSNQNLSEQHEIIQEQNAELRATLQHLKDTQAQLLQADKMASLGVLTAGVAHEMNNPLNYISGAYTGLRNLLNEADGIDARKKEVLLRSLKTGMDKALDIIKGLNQFSRSNDDYDEDCHIPSILDNCLAILNNRIIGKIEVQKQYDPVVTTIAGNVGKLHQVFINIITNAIQAITNSGTIGITTGADKTWLNVLISDTGAGIAEENMAKITDPFFTTKAPGVGTGLGLSISYNIIRELGGKLEFESEPDKGTSVNIRLPLTKEL